MLALLPWQSLKAQDELFGISREQDSLATDTPEADSLAKAQLDSLPWNRRVEQKLARLLDNPIFQTSQVGLMVYDLTADSVLFQHRERQVMRPASTMKLLTAIAAIDLLGGSYRLVTHLKYSGNIADGTLYGTLYCQGGFDPLFNRDDLHSFVESIRRMGVDTIRGSIVADVSLKDTVRWGEGWCWDDDNPVLSPLLISGKDCFLPRLLVSLEEAGVVVEADTMRGVTPADAYAINSRFHTIDQVLIPMMKESDNLFAESLFYHLAAWRGTPFATAKMAREQLKRLLDKVIPESTLYRIADGSGLSLYNYLTPAIEVALLRYAYHSSPIYLHLYPSLPVAGEDGTLKNRMKGAFTQGNVRAKTGTLLGVTSLAGYLQAANGHLLCFAIMNQGLMHTKHGRHFQDRVCTVLSEP